MVNGVHGFHLFVHNHLLNFAPPIVQNPLFLPCTVLFLSLLSEDTVTLAVCLQSLVLFASTVTIAFRKAQLVSLPFAAFCYAQPVAAFSANLHFRIPSLFASAQGLSSSSSSCLVPCWVGEI